MHDLGSIRFKARHKKPTFGLFIIGSRVHVSRESRGNITWNISKYKSQKIKDGPNWKSMHLHLYIPENNNKAFQFCQISQPSYIYKYIPIYSSLGDTCTFVPVLQPHLSNLPISHLLQHPRKKNPHPRYPTIPPQQQLRNVSPPKTPTPSPYYTHIDNPRLPRISYILTPRARPLTLCLLLLLLLAACAALSQLTLGEPSAAPANSAQGWLRLLSLSLSPPLAFPLLRRCRAEF